MYDLSAAFRRGVVMSKLDESSSDPSLRRAMALIGCQWILFSLKDETGVGLCSLDTDREAQYG